MGVSMDDEIEDDLKIRRRKLIQASKSARTKEEVQEALKPFKSKGITFIYDEREVTITREFQAIIHDPNNKSQRREEVCQGIGGITTISAGIWWQTQNIQRQTAPRLGFPSCGCFPVSGDGTTGGFCR